LSRSINARLHRRTLGKRKFPGNAGILPASRSAIAIIFIGLLSVTVRPAAAQSLESLLPEILINDDTILEKKAEVAVARHEALEAMGNWYPEMEINFTHGYERIDGAHAAVTSLPFQDADISFTQLLWDFGATNAEIEGARLELAKAEAELVSAKIALISNVLDFYVQVYHNHLQIELAKETLRKMQERHVNARFAKEARGDAKDVLKLEKEILKQEADMLGIVSDLAESKNEFHRIFGFHPDPTKFVPVKLPADLLPPTLDQAIEQALKNGIQLISGSNTRLDAAIDRLKIKQTEREEFYPKLEGVIEHKWKNNFSGTADLKKEFAAKLELSYSLNLGLTAINTLRAAENQYAATARSVHDFRRNLELSVRQNWDNLRIKLDKARVRRNQARLADEFLAAVITSGKAGGDVLDDVLKAEEDRLDGLSDAIEAEGDAIVSAYKLLALTGQIDQAFLGVDTGAPVPSAPAISEDATYKSPPRSVPPKPSPKAARSGDQRTYVSPSAYRLIQTARQRPVAARPVAPVRRQPAPATSTDATAPGPAPANAVLGVSPEAVRPFHQFFGTVRGIFDQRFKDNATTAPGDRRNRP